jgi:hypothetical protein
MGRCGIIISVGRILLREKWFILESKLSWKFWVNIYSWLLRPSIQWLCRKNQLLASAVNISSRRSENLANTSCNTLTQKQTRHLWHIILCSTQNASFRSMCRYKMSCLYNIRLKAIYFRALYDKYSYHYRFATIPTRLLLYYFSPFGCTAQFRPWPLPWNFPFHFSY